MRAKLFHMRLTAFSILILVLSGCSERQSVELVFSASFGEQPVSCTSSAPSLNDLRFFVSEFSAIDADGKRVSLGLSDDNEFQSPAVALVDLESGDGSCTNGTPELNADVTIQLPKDADFQSLEFSVGVPFASNHQDPLSAAAPLDDSAMHWHWRSGYKFMRAGLDTGEAVSWLHLGSTGCMGQTRAIQSCKNPNRVTVTLPYQAALVRGVDVQLDQLFLAVDLAADRQFDCSSGPLEESCLAVFPALGLGVNTPQAVFRVTPE